MPEKPLDSFLMPRRFCAAERTISEITKKDVRVSILGTIIDKKDNMMVLDDGTGRTEIKFEDAVNMDVGQIARVLAG
jgi:hypothetical protein